MELHVRKGSQPRIFIGLIDIASYYSGLKQGLDEIGIESAFVTLYRNKWCREVTTNPKSRLLSLVHDVAYLNDFPFQSGLLSQLHARVLLPLARLLLLVWACLRYDVFVFGFGRTFFDFRDLPVLRLLGKKIICVFNGSESRPPYISGHFVRATSASEANSARLARCIASAQRQKQVIATIERYAHLCINHPPQAHFHQRKYINHCFIGHPCEPRLTRTSRFEVSAQSDKVRIVHAPTAPGPKGTDVIRGIIQQLKEAGRAIEYVELINKSNEEVLEELQRCDFVIDELYSDIPLAGLGAEAAFFGKPAVVGGYAQAELSRYASKIGLPMTLYVRPEEVRALVERLIADTEFRERCGAAAHRFITTYWSPAEVARRFLRLINGDIPEEWWYDPGSNSYLYGWGAPEGELRCYLRKFLDTAGPAGLQVADKPGLQDAFLRFAAVGTAA